MRTGLSQRQLQRWKFLSRNPASRAASGRAMPLPLRAELVPEPGGLPLGILTRCDLGASDRLVDARSCRRSAACSSRTPIAFMAGSSGSRPSAVSAFTSSIAPSSTMRSKRVSMRATSSARSGSITRKRALAASTSGRPASRLPFEDRAARRLQHLQRPDDALAVGRAAASCAASGSSAEQDAMQLRRALLRQLVAPAVADGGRDLRHVGNARQRARGNRGRCRRRRSAGRPESASRPASAITSRSQAPVE